MQHTCLLIKPRATDYLMGDGHIIFKAVANGDWTSHAQFFERQKFAFDSNGCVPFCVQESFDCQMDLLLATAPASIVKQVTSMGYMNTGRDNALHFHSSPRFLQILTGNGYHGNSIPEVWDVIRKYGILPWTDLPFDATTTSDEYISPAAITRVMYDKASQFLTLIGGKDSVQYHFLNDGSPKNVPLMQAAMLQAPLCVGVAVAGNWNQQIPSPDPSVSASPEHCMMSTQILPPLVDCLDHYDPFQKTLDAGYPINYALQGVVTIAITPVPSPVPLPPNPTPSQIQQWINAVKAWLAKILTQTQK